MTKINYDNKTFASVQNSETGDVNTETVFHYHQKDNLVWAEYAGGEIVFGSLIAKVTDEDSLEMRYQHLNAQGKLMTGKCFSIPEILADGRIRLYEKWQWTSGNLAKGESIVEEIQE
ncbi:MAG: n-acetylglutamate synthase [Acidobacteriota bacterium]|nr:n-acetylglutamate synthase [Acidobacteriota bacterium]